MDKHRVIPEGYMKVGELAKKAGITVRTLQYYDKEGLLPPSAESDGGFRLYTDKDMAKLIQILMMKQLGFTLDALKKRLTSLETPSDVVKMLTEHAAQTRRKIEFLSESLEEMEALKEEIMQIEAVDFKKFASILLALQVKNKHYRMIKHLDEDVLEKLIGGMSREEARALTDTVAGLYDEAVKLQRENAAPESEKGQAVAGTMWATMMKFTGGDIDLIHKLNEINKSDKNRDKNTVAAYSYIESALGFYFSSQSEREGKYD